MGWGRDDVSGVVVVRVGTGLDACAQRPISRVEPKHASNVSQTMIRITLRLFHTDFFIIKFCTISNDNIAKYTHAE